jgi:hypothetical protein
MGEMRNAYKILVGIPDGERLLERHGRRWEDSITLDFKEMGRGVDWINLAEDSVRLL